ncbi:hypothetical protein [Actinoplanes couchii]|uniref:Integral membrane protein n=1 Tax=Actinoplanes couchii TaxID=403638 RepID=A0ABQ3XKX3_9ACTN|nr:hypothetical protein [Actinoplanes couchii]MDR6319519.1 hypothetical protein [Actinoplanes couchii]GID59092.1 hypothetical protein Aco03nite_074960 [Actinoplanes couchii]
MKRLLAALTIAALGAAAGGWLGWRGAGDLPTDAEARALVAAAVPDESADFVERYDVLFGHQWGPAGTAVVGSEDYRAGYAVVSVNVPADGYDALVARARQGFLDQGWEIEDEDDGLFDAIRDDLTVSAYPANRCGPENTEECGSQVMDRAGALGLQFERTPPWPVLPLTAVGWLLGLMAGRLLAVRAKPQDSALLWAGLALLLPATVVVTIGLLAGPGVPWDPYMYLLFRPFALLGAAFLVAVIALAVMRRPVPATHD